MPKQTKYPALKLVFLASILVLSGCTRHQHVVIPMPASKDIDPGQYSLDQYTANLQSYETYTSKANIDLTAAKLARNDIAYGLMTQIEVVYGAYYRRLFGGKNTVAIVGDFVSLGLGSAGSIATNSATKRLSTHYGVVAGSGLASGQGSGRTHLAPGRAEGKSSMKR